MVDKLSHDDLAQRTKEPGWHLDTGDTAKTSGTLEEVLKAAHERQQSGKRPGIIKQIETSIELDMLQIEQLWRYLGLPV